MAIRFSNLSIKQRYLFVVIPVIILGLLLSIILIDNQTSTILLESEYRSMEKVVDEIDKALNLWLDDQVNKTIIFSKMDVFKQACKGKQLDQAKTLLEDYFRQTNIYENLFIASPDGKIFLLANGDANSAQIDISKLDTYKTNAEKAIRGEKFISNAGISPASGRPVILITAPIIEDGKVIGIMGTPLELNIFTDIFVNKEKIGQTGYAFMTDPKGLVIAYPDKDQILKLNLADYDFGKEMLRLKNGRYFYNWQGKEIVAVFKTNTITNWLICARVTKSEFLLDVKNIKNFLALIDVLFIFVIVLVIYFITNSTVRVIGNVTNRLKDIAQGEGDLTKRIDYIATNEIGELAKWFNIFVEKIQGLVKSVIDVTSQVKIASNEISTASEEMASGAEEQQSQLSEIATSIEEMSAMILETSKNTNETQSNATQADNAAIEGQNTVAETINGIDNVVRLTQSAAQQIAKLEERSKEIGEVIQVIDDIADQTNLLALNANIEAARAGEAGRGFAVVADEVRKLAERTVRATAEIGDKIKQIQHEVSSSVAAMNQVVNISSESQQIAGKARLSLENIRTLVSNVTQAITQIATATDQQSSGAEEISKNIESVSSVAKQTAARAQELASSVEELDREIHNLKQLIGQFKVNQIG